MASIDMKKYEVKPYGSRFAVYSTMHNTIQHTFSTLAKANAWCAKLNA